MRPRHHSFAHVGCFAGQIYHALNRGNARNKIFFKDADFEAFERVVQLGLEKYPVDLIAYQWMGNHWHNLAPDTFFSPYKKRVGQVSLLTQFFSFLKPQEPFFCEVKCSPINLLSGRENELFSSTKNSFVCRYFLVRHKQLQWSIRYRRKRPTKPALSDQIVTQYSNEYF